MLNQKNRYLMITISLITLVATFLAGKHFYQRHQMSEREKVIFRDKERLVPQDAVWKGAQHPRVYLVEFLDPQCESCRRFHQPLKEILADYPDQVRLVVRYAPFHSHSIQAIKILEASRQQDLYWTVLEQLFRTQPSWGDHHNPNPDLMWSGIEELARKGQLDLEQLRQDMLDPKIVDRIARDRQDLSYFEVRATPSFYINGRPLTRFGPAPLRAAIEQALAE